MNFDLGDLRPRDPGVGALVVEGVGVLDRRPRGFVVADGGDRTFDGGGQAHGHRHIGAGANRRTNGGVAVERRIAPNQRFRRTVPARSAGVRTQPVDGGQRIGDHAGGAARGAAGSSPQALGEDHRRTGLCGDGGDEGVQPADPGVAVSGALFAVAVDLDDRIVDIDQDSPGVDAGHQRGLLGEVAQEPRRDGVELPDVLEGELAEKRSQRRRCIGSIEDGSHRPVPQDRQVGDAVGAGDHPTDQGPDLAARVGALVGRHAQVLIGEREQAAGLRQCHHRDQSRGRHEVGIVEPGRRNGSGVR